MENSKENKDYIEFRTSDSLDSLFEKVRSWEISSQLDFAVSLDNPKRKQLLDMILDAVSNEALKQNINLIVKRIEHPGFFISEYTEIEMEHYNSLFARDFIRGLHSENYFLDIEDKIRELYFFCKSLELDLRIKEYEYLEDREYDKNLYTEYERYKCYLEKLLVHLKHPSSQQTELENRRLKVPQIALIHVYEEIKITEQNAAEIAAKYYYTSRNSGKGLYDDYLKYCKPADRKAKPTSETKRAFKSKIDLFKSVLPYLSDKAKARAIDEIIILETIFEKEYQ